jgi:glucan biosynthesis protein C
MPDPSAEHPNPVESRKISDLQRNRRCISEMVTVMDATIQNDRYHALDSMRAVMMLLGIYLHVVVGYSGNGHWPYIDAHPTSALDFTLGIIHSFRMPAFFVMAGFFGALLWNRRGPRPFMVNRTRRILLPFVLFWALLFPVMAVIVISLEQGPAKIVPAFTSGVLLKRLHPLHLWFLEYLLMLYAAGAAVAWSSRWVPATWIGRVHSAYRWALQRWFAPAVFALFSWLPLTAMRGNLKDCDGFAPEWLILAAYLGPFGFGWLLYHSRDLLPRFERHIGSYLALAVPAFLVYGIAPGGSHPFLKAAGNVLLCWLLIFACTGLFLRYSNGPSFRWRYLSDSSYWLYIMHMPVVVGLQVASRYLPLPALAKVPVVLGVAVLVLVASYDVMVRATWIGALLNGRRYPRLAAAAAERQPAEITPDTRPGASWTRLA